jgi:hypothetical protein
MPYAGTGTSRSMAEIKDRARGLGRCRRHAQRVSGRCTVMVIVMAAAAAAVEIDDGRGPGRHAHRVPRGRAEIKKGSTHASRVR